MFKGVDESVIFVFLPLSRQELADLLGVHRTTLILQHIRERFGLDSKEARYSRNLTILCLTILLTR